MKKYSQKHEAIIESYFKPVDHNAKIGQVVKHNETVLFASIYKCQFINDQEVYLKIDISRDLILDLAKEIESIEANVIEKEFIDVFKIQRHENGV
jgi:hypothetical protein